MRNAEPYAGGLALNFFESQEFEDDQINDDNEKTQRQTRNLLRILMGGWSEKWRDLLSSRMAKAVFVARDHQLTQAMRLAFQEGFHHIFSQLRNQQLTEQQHNQAQLYISNCLTYLPFGDTTVNESFAVPQYLDGAWQLVEYAVVPIELTPTSGFEKLVLSDSDRVFAYGLEPLSHPHAEPHLIFMGTTYPAGQGFTTMVNTDLEAFETAGKKLYRTGHENISRWLDKQLPKKTHVCGSSLGGALSLLVAIDQGHKLSRVDALNPPGLYDPWRKSSFDHWDELADKPAVYIQKQGNDPVSRFGVWKSDWNVLHVTPPADKKGPNQVTDHALNYAGFADTKFIQINTDEDNQERKTRNRWLYSALRGAFYLLVMVPYRFLILPPIRFIFTHKLQLAIMALVMGLFILIPALVVPIPALSITFNALFHATVSSYVLTDLIQFVSDRLSQRNDADLSKLLNALSNRPLMSIAVGMLVASTAIAFTLSVVLLPELAPLATLALVSLPLICSTINKVRETILTLTGFNDVERPDYQNPSLPRNDSLDIHKNSMEASFTYKEIGDYYIAKRCILKSKGFLPEVGADTFFKNTGRTKHDVLSQSKHDESQNLSISFSATKAKIHDMRHTLYLIQKIGFHQPAELKKALFLGQQDYKNGKP